MLLDVCCRHYRAGNVPKCRICNRNYNKPKQVDLDRFAKGAAGKIEEVAQTTANKDKKELEKLRKEVADMRGQLAKAKAGTVISDTAGAEAEHTTAPEQPEDRGKQTKLDLTK